MTDMKTKPAPKKKSVKRRAAPVVRDTFTVRDLNRQPQVVLTAARKLGEVVVRSRSGEQFSVQLLSAPKLRAATRGDFVERLKQLHASMRAKGSTGFTAEGWETFSKTIAGE